MRLAAAARATGEEPKPLAFLARPSLQDRPVLLIDARSRARGATDCSLAFASPALAQPKQQSWPAAPAVAVPGPVI